MGVPFDGGFHIDVVPGLALDAQYYEANLHRTDTGTTLKTGLKKHIDTVRGSGRADAIRLMKLWKVRKAVPFKKSFLLELMTIDGCKGKQSDDLEGKMIAALKYVRDNIKACSVSDPANSNNSLSDDLDTSPTQLLLEGRRMERGRGIQQFRSSGTRSNASGRSMSGTPSGLFPSSLLTEPRE